MKAKLSEPMINKKGQQIQYPNFTMHFESHLIYGQQWFCNKEKSEKANFIHE